jgi:hypothetical protein
VRLVLGVDGGGSKTHALVADERGEVLSFASSGRANWEDIGLEAAGAALAAAVSGALDAAQVAPGALAASAFGLAGLDWDADRPMLGALLDPLGLGGPRMLENDAFVALRAGASRPFGVVVIAGDLACREIVLRTGVALGEAAAAVARRLGLGGERFETVMAGGLFQSRNRLLEGALVDTLHRAAPLAAPVHLTCNPVVGAALEALDLAGVAAGPEVRERLVASSRGLAVAPGA